MREIFEKSGSKYKALEELLSEEDLGILSNALILPQSGTLGISENSGGGISYNDFIGFATDFKEDTGMGTLHETFQHVIFKKMNLNLNSLGDLFMKGDPKMKGFIRVNDFIKVIHKIHGNMTPKEEKLLLNRFVIEDQGIVDYNVFVWWVFIGDKSTLPKVL
jgi:Ca2+-binding EF-hand superfamily protein